MRSSMLQKKGLSSYIIMIGIIVLLLQSSCSKPQLSRAVINYDYGRVQYLVDLGADINIRDEYYYRTPLIYAAYYRNRIILEYLIEHDAELNHQDKDGWTALIFAAYYNDLHNVKALVKGGADLDIRNNDGYTALDYSIYFNFDEIALYLIKNGAKRYSR